MDLQQGDAIKPGVSSMNMLRYMQPFHTDYIPKVLLTGNGLHRAFEDAN